LVKKNFQAGMKWAANFTHAVAGLEKNGKVWNEGEKTGLGMRDGRHHRELNGYLTGGGKFKTPKKREGQTLRCTVRSSKL